MSSIKLESNASGTGVFTIASPNSNTNRTLSIPDATGTINTSGAVNEVPAGSAAAPSIYPTGDTNTGIYFPAADTIAFAEGGTEVMRIDSSGNVGIGTSLPARKFEVIANSAPAAQFVRTTTATNTVQTNPVVIARTSGNMADGFGTLVNHQIQDDAGVDNTIGYYGFVRNGADNSGAFYVSTSNAGTVAERVRIDSSGNLLVNTTTAQTGAKLAVTGGIQGTITSGTAVTCAGQTSIDFTGIPSWVKRITVMFSGVSTSGTSLFLVQLGDAGGFETTGYTSQANSITTTPAVTATTNTAGFVLGASALVAANTYSGTISIVKLDGNSWVYSSLIIRDGTASSNFGAGSKTLSDTLTQVRITTVNGTDTFDTTPSAGTINILYEG